MPPLENRRRQIVHRWRFQRETRAEANGAGIIAGYGAVFDVVNSYQEIVVAGAFTNTIQKWKQSGNPMPILWQHEGDEVIGRWTTLEEDTKGLRCVGQMNLDTDCGKEAFALLAAGDLNGLSIGFVAVQDAYNYETELRTLQQVDLWEISIVTWPANDAARVTEVRSAERAARIDAIQTPADAERFLRDARGLLSRSEITALVSRAVSIGRREADDKALAKWSAGIRQRAASLTP